MTSYERVGCGGWDFESHTRAEEIDYRQCKSCLVIFPRGIPDQAALPIIYPPNYYAFSETVKPNAIVAAVRGWMARKKGATYTRLLPAAEAQVVDVGCGDGPLLDILKTSCPPGWRYHRIDCSPT